MKVTQLSEYADDPHLKCEYDVDCDEPACAWSIPDGSGYVDSCGKHAQEVVDDAVAEGRIVRNGRDQT